MQTPIAVFAGEPAALLPVFRFDGGQPTGMVIDQRIRMMGDKFDPALIRLNVEFDGPQS